ncbi:hypothetical protein JTB14_034399 [Gonioctena quinquepunctata]|nr:hypothetical protein JTB14_034399 [Gonioctena quinquepunctata]
MENSKYDCENVIVENDANKEPIHETNEISPETSLESAISVGDTDDEESSSNSWSETKGLQNDDDDDDDEFIGRNQENRGTLRRSDRVPKPELFEDYVTYLSLGDTNNLERDPTTFRDALARPDEEKWRQAIQDELHSFEVNGAWELVDVPDGGRILQCKHVRHHIVRDAINENLIKIEYLQTADMPADVLTKSLCSVKHYKFLGYLGVVEIK